MAITTNWDKFEKDSLKEGYGLREVPYLPGAREAIERDKQADWDVRVHAKKETWTNYDDQGKKIDYFRSPEEFRAAMADPLYKVSDHYRQAIQRMLRNTREDIIQTPSQEDNQGMGGLRGMTPAKMLAAATKDAAIATYKKLAVEASHDPVKRLELLTLMNSTDPNVQAWLHEGTSGVSPEGPMNRAMRERGYGEFGPDLNAAMAGNETSDADNGGQ